LSPRRIAELTRVLRHMLNHIEQTSAARQAEVRQQVQASPLPTLAAGDA
jgi:hypothetical protein